jgi:hypothetical protein
LSICFEKIPNEAHFYEQFTDELLSFLDEAYESMDAESRLYEQQRVISKIKVGFLI